MIIFNKKEKKKSTKKRLKEKEDGINKLRLNFHKLSSNQINDFLQLKNGLNFYLFSLLLIIFCGLFFEYFNVCIVCGIFFSAVYGIFNDIVNILFADSFLN